MAGSPDQHNTGGADRRGSSTIDPSCGASGVAESAASTEAEILLGVTSWLAAARDWLEDEIDLARGRLGPGNVDDARACLPVRLSDAERALEGLRSVVGLLDGLPIDPSSVRALGMPARPSVGVLQ